MASPYQEFSLCPPQWPFLSGITRDSEEAGLMSNSAFIPQKGLHGLLHHKRGRVDSSHQELRHWFQMDMNNLQSTQEPKKRQPPSEIKPLVPTWGCVFCAPQNQARRDSSHHEFSLWSVCWDAFSLWTTRGSRRGSSHQELSLGSSGEVREFSPWSKCVAMCSLCTTREHRRSSYHQKLSIWFLHGTLCFSCTRGSQKNSARQEFSLQCPHGPVCPLFTATEHSRDSSLKEFSLWSSHETAWSLCTQKVAELANAIRNSAFGPQLELHVLFSPQEGTEENSHEKFRLWSPPPWCTMFIIHQKRAQKRQLPLGIQPLLPTWGYPFFRHNKGLQKR